MNEIKKGSTVKYKTGYSMRTFYLITNCSGMKYWSWLGDESNTVGNHAAMVAKHGPIYINQRGGWFPKSAAVTVHKTVTQENFPQSY